MAHGDKTFCVSYKIRDCINKCYEIHTDTRARAHGANDIVRAGPLFLCSPPPFDIANLQLLLLYKSEFKSTYIPFVGPFIGMRVCVSASVPVRVLHSICKFHVYLAIL